MYDIDTAQAFLLIKALSQQAGDALGLPKNAGVLVQPKQPRQPANVAPSGVALEIAVQLTLNKMPINPTAGYVFGSSEKDCDILLDTVTDRGVSSTAFSIKSDRKTQALKLECLAQKGIYFREIKDFQPKQLQLHDRIPLQPGYTWIIILGSIQIALSAIRRDHSEQQAYDKNFKDYLARLDKAIADVGKLKPSASATSTTSITETPDTRFFTGLWNNYTAAGRVGEGGMASITACISKTGVTCCIKEAKAGDSRKAKIRQDAIRLEIICLQRIAHPSIVQYIDRGENFAWVAMGLARLGDLEQQHIKMRLTSRETEVVIYQVLHALSHIHSRDILHHDIKPENILVQIRNGDQILVKIADFGLASRISNNPGALKGTFDYLAPECFKRHPKFWGPKIDVWALAMVALRLLCDLPALPKDPGARDFSPRNPYAEGWGGAIKTRFAKYEAKSQRVSDSFCNTLSHMFDSEPEARIGALEAWQNLRKDYLRKGYPPGYFFSVGERTPAIIKPVPVADTRSDDASIFRFRKLNIEGLSEPLIMLEGCYLVNLRRILIAKFKGKRVDYEFETWGAVKEYVEKYGHTFWRFKRTNEFPEIYISIEIALALCQQEAHLRILVDTLREQRALRDASDNEGPGKRQRILIESTFTSQHVIAITEEGRMLLVRPRDGYIYSPSVQAVVNKRLLSTNDLGDPLAYMPLYGATLVPGVMSHDDIFSLGAATYSSF